MTEVIAPLLIEQANLAVTGADANPKALAGRERGHAERERSLHQVSVVECFETDGGVNYRINRLISFYFMRLSFDAASDVFGLCCV